MRRQQKLVVAEFLTKPSAVSPTLFVGIGGCGCAMVARIADHLRQRPDYSDRYKELVKFALIDTNVNDLEARREIADETFLISDFEKEQYANLAAGKLFLEEDPYFTQWVPQTYRFRAGDTAGAGQIRIEARLGIYYQMKHKSFVPRFRKLLEDLKSHEHGHRRLDSTEIRIIICYSIAGGTGSGAHLPIAYMLRDQAKELGSPWMIGVSVMPAVFEDKTGINKDGTFANGYAALKELEHLMKLGSPDSRFFPEGGITFHYNPNDESKKNVRQKPFEFVYIVDKPESFSVSDPIAAAADGLYLQFFSPLFTRQASDYDNYTQHQRFLVPHDFEAKGIGGFTSFYGSYGAAVLMVPVRGLAEYCSQASALSLMRANFVRDIPGEPLYASLRTNRAQFDEVTLGNEKNERPIHRADFNKRERAVRDQLRDRLFMKRVRLLAACEVGEEAKRFLAIFRHGHRVGERPTTGGNFELRDDQIKFDEKQLSDRRMNFSINAIVLRALVGKQGSKEPELLSQAREAIRDYEELNRYVQQGSTTAANLKIVAAGMVDEFKRVGLRKLRNGYKDGTLSFPGMDSLVELDFLKSEAGEVDLAAKRYAVLRILEEVKWTMKPPERGGIDFELDDTDDSKTMKEEKARDLMSGLVDQAIQHAMAEVARGFIESLGDLKTNLDRYAEVQRILELGFDELERDQSMQLDRLRREGDPSTDQYILDAEALRLEDGRRMWDFYYQDRVVNLPELSLSNKKIQQVLSDTVTDLSVSGAGSTTATLDKLFAALRGQAHEYILPRIAGDPKSTDRERNEGLTLSDSLELEVVYRALYQSDKKRIDREGPKAIGEIMAQYRAQETDQQLNLTDPLHKDYLRDKVKRVVKEKASLLCVYDESRDQHGGVRPDQVFLAAIDENFKNSTIEETLRGADIPNLEWVSTGWHNPKEIIFYRSVLNVPLYVFGRLDEMKHYYQRFRKMERRSKVLHIDKNWENLPNLDPGSAKERHRQKQVRDNIVNFAALLTIGRKYPMEVSAEPPVETPTEGKEKAVIPVSYRREESYIIRRGGRYYLVDPKTPPDGGGLLDSDQGAGLGETLAQAIEHLPEVLKQERVKYLPYQQVLRSVRLGFMPRVLERIASLPFQWRRNRDDLRTQYGSNPDQLQEAKLKDYSDSFKRLREALDTLLETLRNREIEQRTLGEDAAAFTSQLKRDQAEKNLRQSIEILRAFSETWQRMENPEDVRDVPPTFSHLFDPFTEDELDNHLKRLRQAFSIDDERERAQGGGGTPESSVN